MFNYAIRRLALAILVALTVSVIGFFLLRLSGDLGRALAGQNATPEQVAAIRAAYGLDRPLPVQYLDWLFSFLRGDLGQSFYFKQPAADLIFTRLPTTLLLGALSLGLAVCIAIPFGVLAGVYRNSLLDRIALVCSSAGQSVPNFWVALLLISWFGLSLRWLPISGSDSWINFVMPAVAMAFPVVPPILRLTRAGMVDVLSTDYIRTARAKGLPPRVIIFKHALRNALVPVVAVAAVQLGILVGGSVVIESIFAIQGIGYLAWESIVRTDFLVVQAILVVISVIYVLLTLIADLLNAALDPRMRSR